MGHSKNQLLAILDLPYRQFGKQASVTYNDVAYPVKKLLGIQKFTMALQQTQGGLSSGQLQWYKEKNQLKSKHNNARQTVQDWTMVEKEKQVILQQKNTFRILSYQFDQQADNYCLKSAHVQLWNKKEAAFSIEFFPALPDFRRKFEGEQVAKFVLDINGQMGHALGEITSYWENDQLLVEIIPEKPWWTEDRPMLMTIGFENGGVDVDCQMK